MSYSLRSEFSFFVFSMKIPVNKLFTFASLIGCFGLIQVINAQVPLGVSNQSLQQAQAKVGFSSFSPQWEKEFQIPFPQDPSRFLTVPAFKESMLDDKIANLPFYKVMIPLSGSEALTLLQSSVGDESDVFSSIYDLPLQSVPGGLQGDYYPASNVVLGERVTWIKKDYQIVKIYPIRIAVSGGSYKKAGKVEYNLGKIPYQSPYAARSFNKTATATSSVLSSGRWFKIAVTHDGIYKLDAAYFASIGIDPATVDPRKIRIHGNGGGMLPQPNSTFRHDDLAENSIYVAGESDGVFNNGDYLLFFGGTPHPWAFDSNKVWNAYYPAYYHFQNVYSDTNYYFNRRPDSR